MATPLEIRLIANKAAVIVGEQPLLSLSIRILADLDMESVALNRSRTTILIESFDGAPAVHLTGQDHIRFHGIHPLTEIGSRFHAEGGSEWTEPLNLLLYGSGLAAGRYRICLSYRFGQEDSDTANAGPVAVEVVPANHLSNAYRWYGGADAYTELANLWRAEADGKIRWIYQFASRKNPAAVLSAVDVSIPPTVAPFTPVLAHLNEIADFQFERAALWVESSDLGLVFLHKEGRNREPVSYPHGLIGARVVEPPLQVGAGDVFVVLSGVNTKGAACAVLIHVTPEGARERIEIALPEIPDFAVVAWSLSTPATESLLYWGRRDESKMQVTPLRLPPRAAAVTVSGELRSVAIEQWLGAGGVTALLADAAKFQSARFPILAAPSVSAVPLLDSGTDGPVELLGFLPIPKAEASAVLLRDSNGWLAAGKEVYRAAPDEEEGTHPHLLATPNGGLWLCGFHRSLGFRIVRFTPPEPPPSI